MDNISQYVRRLAHIDLGSLKINGIDTNGWSTMHLIIMRIFILTDQRKTDDQVIMIDIHTHIIIDWCVGNLAHTYRPWL